ncbi:MAG TPA: Npt1/Npt2 family nucleotide transporter, partial [Rhabdochlamydiaceae bacterium]
MSAETSPEFGKLRNFFWPIHRDELKLFLPLLIMYFLICLNYSILRTSRDALVITAKSAGAEVLPFIKTWAILPASLLIMLFFTQLSNRLSKEKVFYIMISLFLLFFSLFAFVLYPCHESL